MPSTFTKDDKFVCASNPDIDNNLKFGNTTVFHEGYEKNRQDKVKNICDYIKKSNKKIKLRVCYRSKNGDNCCKCEKCYRTIMAILTQDLDPNELGFEFDDEVLEGMKKCLEDREKLKPSQIALWRQIQNYCIKNRNKFENNEQINWIFGVNLQDK